MTICITLDMIWKILLIILIEFDSNLQSKLGHLSLDPITDCSSLGVAHSLQLSGFCFGQKNGCQYITALFCLHAGS